MHSPLIHAFVYFAAGCLTAGIALMIYHLAHAPVGRETEEGFEALSPPKPPEFVPSDSTMGSPASPRP